MDYNKKLDGPLPGKLKEDLELDKVLEEYSDLRNRLVERIKVLKIMGGKYGDMAKVLGKSPSAISDLLNPGTDHYRWSYSDIEKALEKLNDFNLMEVYDENNHN